MVYFFLENKSFNSGSKKILLVHISMLWKKISHHDNEETWRGF